jgi:hypothetical protein
MTKNPAARPTAADLLRHEWLAQHGSIISATAAEARTSSSAGGTPPRSPNALIPLGAASAKCRSSPLLTIHVDATCQIPSSGGTESGTKLVVPRRSGISNASQRKSASVFDLSAAAAAAVAEDDAASRVAAALSAASLSEDEATSRSCGKQERRRTGSGKLKRQLGSWLKSFRSRRHSANVNESDVSETMVNNDVN